ncbi:hypothetical protein, partial [Chryseobacterium indoltheticum]|uniref:hypothetical protein n=1 Tax=Chryseobacterium indoltheticum TaxID=254 RepID=UPI003F490A56
MKKISIFFIFLPLIYFSQITLNTTVLETNFGGDSTPKEIIKIDNKLFFTAVSNDQNFTEKRKVFLKQNLTSKATAININNNQYNSVSIVGNLDSIVFVVVDVNYSTDKQIWRTDGTNSGTYFVKSIDNTAGTDITNFTFLDDKFFFTYYNANSNHLWASDGTSVNTNKIGSFSSITNLAPINGYAIFSTQNNSGNTLIYKTNGTIGGTNIINS